MTDDEKLESSRIEKNTNGPIATRNLKIWQSLVKNYEMVEGAHLSNSLVILLALIDGAAIKFCGHL